MQLFEHGKKAYATAWYFGTVNAALFAFCGLPAEVYSIIVAGCLALVTTREGIAKWKGRKDGQAG